MKMPKVEMLSISVPDVCETVSADVTYRGMATAYDKRGRAYSMVLRSRLMSYGPMQISARWQRRPDLDKSKSRESTVGVPGQG